MFQATVTRDEIIHYEGTRTVSHKLGCAARRCCRISTRRTCRRRPTLPLCQRDLSRCDIRILGYPCHGYLGTTVIGHWAWPVSLSRRSAVTSGWGFRQGHIAGVVCRGSRRIRLKGLSWITRASPRGGAGWRARRPSAAPSRSRCAAAEPARDFRIDQMRDMQALGGDQLSIHR